MFELDKYLDPPRSNNGQDHDNNWDTRDKSFSEDEIYKSIKDALPVPTQNKVDKKQTYYRSIPDEDWIDLLGNIKSMYNSRPESITKQNPSSKNMYDQP